VAAEGDDDRKMRDETPVERADRNYTELLQELRVAQTGVQILFAFLLTIPFQQRFGQMVGAGLRQEYLATLLVTAAATALLIAPVSMHRILFRQGLKPQLVTFADAMAKIGLAFLALAVLLAVFLIVSVVSARDTAIWFVGSLGLLFSVTWIVIPIWLRTRD
jgi:uncharacterized protein DUF6328